MKTKMISVSAFLFAAAVLSLNAGETAKAPQTSAEFEKLKTLVGTWQGKADMGQGPIDMKVQYRLLASGSVVEERSFPGTPHEMVTMFYNKDGHLALTHYCVMGNRPGMVLKSSDEKSLIFAFDDSCGINPQKESHMHALSMRFDDANTIIASCKAIMDGKEMAEKPTVLKRVTQ